MCQQFGDTAHHLSRKGAQNIDMRCPHDRFARSVNKQVWKRNEKIARTSVKTILNLQFSEQWLEGVISSGMWRNLFCRFGWKLWLHFQCRRVSTRSKRQAKNLRLAWLNLNLEVGDVTFLRNFVKLLAEHVVLHSRRFFYLQIVVERNRVNQVTALWNRRNIIERTIFRDWKEACLLIEVSIWPDTNVLKKEVENIVKLLKYVAWAIWKWKWYQQR
jgi:hypothetical protein